MDEKGIGEEIWEGGRNKMKTKNTLQLRMHYLWRV